jgi:hypothetical protein
MTPVLCGLFKLLSSDSLGTEYVTTVIPEQICMAWVNVMIPVLCGLFKRLSSDSLGTEYVTTLIPEQICIAWVII